MDFLIWYLMFLCSIINPTAEYPSTACELAQKIITANTPNWYDENGEMAQFDRRLIPMVAAFYPYCRQEVVAQGREDLGSKWRPGMTLSESKQFRLRPASHIYNCVSIDWDPVVKLAEFTGQPVKEVNLWKREQAIDLLYVSAQWCEGCGDYHRMRLNPEGYDALRNAGESDRGLREAATDIGKEYLHFFSHGEGSCSVGDFHSNSYIYDSGDLRSGISWLQKAGWSEGRIKKVVQELRLEEDEREPDRHKEAVQAVNNELMKL